MKLLRRQLSGFDAVCLWKEHSDAAHLEWSAQRIKWLEAFRCRAIYQLHLPSEQHALTKSSCTAPMLFSLWDRWNNGRHTKIGTSWRKLWHEIHARGLLLPQLGWKYFILVDCHWNFVKVSKSKSQRFHYVFIFRCCHGNCSWFPEPFEKFGQKNRIVNISSKMSKFVMSFGKLL